VACRACQRVWHELCGDARNGPLRPPTHAQVLNNLYFALVTLLTLGLLAFTVYSSLKEQRRPGRLLALRALQGGGKARTTAGSPSAGASVGSTPSQLHAILAAAAVEDAAEEVMRALALFRIRERALGPLAGGVDASLQMGDLGALLDGARNMNSGGAEAGALAAGTRRAAGPVAEGSQYEYDNALYEGLVPSIAATTAIAHACGPVAEGTVAGYDNALYDRMLTASSASGSTSWQLEIRAPEGCVQQVAPAEIEVGGQISLPIERATRRSIPSHPLEDSSDNTFVLLEDPRASEVQPTDGAIAPAAVVDGSGDVSSGCLLQPGRLARAGVKPHARG
jgi:hypothetical protein